MKTRSQRTKATASTVGGGVLLAGVALVAAGCGGGGSASHAAASPGGPKSAATVPVTVPVDVVAINVLAQPCEALTGAYSKLHLGAVATIENPDSEVVGRAHLAKSPVKVPAGLCAWRAVVDAHVVRGQKYTAYVGGRWSSKAATAESMIGGYPITIDTSK